MNTSIIPSLAWALLHSVWELMLIAGLLAIFLRFIPGRRASLRFLLSYGGLMLGFVAVVSTFCWYYMQSDQGISPFGDEAFAGFQFDNTPFSEQVLLGQSLFEYLEVWVLENSQFITFLWALGIVILSLFYGFGFLWTQVLRSYRVQAIPDEYQALWQNIYSLSGISKYIEIKQSLLVKGPFTVGHVKPIILVPVGFFTMLSPSQVEAILLHELAHIRRHDYLLNLIQMMVKLVLFYHPATWFICRCIDTEREHACDDLAMSTFADPKAYVRALGLIRIQFFNQKNQWAMQFSKQEPAFIKRLKRLMNPLHEQGSKRSLMNLFLPILLIGLGAIFVSFKSAKELQAQLPGIMIDGPDSAYPIQADTIIPEKEKTLEEIVETPRFPETKKDPDVVIGVQNISKEDELKQKELAEARANLRDAQRMLEIEKLQIEANQARIYDQYELGKLNEIEKNEAIHNLKESYENLLQTEMNLKESQSELKSAYREAYGLNSERSAAERELRIIEGRARDLKKEQETVLRGYRVEAENQARALQREAERARVEGERLTIVEGRVNREAQARVRELAEAERLRGRVMTAENKARLKAERSRLEGIIASNRASRSESFPVRLKKQLVQDGLAKDNNKKVKIKIENGEIYVQGKKLQGESRAKYRAFFRSENLDLDAEHLIEIKTNSFKKSSTKTEIN